MKTFSVLKLKVKSLSQVNFCAHQCRFQRSVLILEECQRRSRFRSVTRISFRSLWCEFWISARFHRSFALCWLRLCEFISIIVDISYVPLCFLCLSNILQRIAKNGTRRNESLCVSEGNRECFRFSDVALLPFALLLFATAQDFSNLLWLRCLSKKDELMNEVLMSLHRGWSMTD